MLRAFVGAVVLLSAGVPAFAGDPVVRVPWGELAPRVNGMQFSTVLGNSARIEGRAISVEPEALLAIVKKSSDRARYQGQCSLPRAEISSVRVRHTGWKWKVISPIVGFVALGALGGFVGRSVDRPSWIISNGAAYGILAGMATGVTSGVLIGRWADRHYTTIQIVK